MRKLLNRLKQLSLLIMIAFCLPLSIGSANAGIIAGNPNGTITLVEFYDYTCPYCRTMNSVVNELMKENPNLRVVYRPLPILHPESWLIASSVIAAQEQANFKILHNALFNTHLQLNEKNILAIANNVGINSQSLVKALNDPAVTQELQSNIQVANELGVQQLPTIIIGGSGAKSPTTVFYGVTSLAKLQASITQAQATNQ